MTPARKPATGPVPAYVLHRHDWSETSLIVELFTREHGRVVVAAKGARRPYSQIRPVLLPLQRIGVQLGRTPPGDAEVHVLRSAEWAGGRPMPGGEALFAGFYLNELLLRLLARQDPHPALFDAYAGTVDALAGPEAARQAALRAFELVMLRELGLLPELDRVTLTVGPLQAGGLYVLEAEAGVRPARAGERGVEAGGLQALEAALGEAGSAMRLQRLHDAVAPATGALRGMLRGLVHYHLGSASLRTRDVVQGVRRLIERPDGVPHTP
jgi:DNA repair protein RecO (recombination protein O)